MKRIYKIVVCSMLMLFTFGLNNLVMGQITSYPFIESFDGTSLPSGWTNEYVSGTIDWATVTINGNSTITPRTGARMAEFRIDNTSSVTKLVSPQLDLTSLNIPQLTFYYANTNWLGDIDELRVYYKSAAGGAWTQIGPAYTDEHTSWTEVSVILPSPSSDYYIAFEGTSNWARGMNIDDVTIEEGPTCPNPTGLVSSSITGNSVGLTWVAGALETQWNVEWGTVGFTPGTGTGLDSASVTAASHTVTGLTPQTNYNIYVQADCGSGDESGWVLLSVQTGCGTQTAPFSETFSTGSLPLCWTNTSSNTVANGLWKFSGVVDYASGNTRPNGTFAWADGSDPSNISDVTLTSPWIDVSSLTTPTVFFDYFSNNMNTYPNNIFKVEAREETGAWTQVYTNNTSSNEWRELEFPLPAFSGTIVQVRFIVDKTAAPSGWAFYNDILLDNVRIDEPTLCPKPTLLTASNVGSNSVDLTWTAGGSETAWNVVWGATGFTPGDANQIGSDVATAIPYTVQGLSSGTDYDIYVQADCGGDGPSLWGNAVKITTSPECGDTLTGLCYSLNNTQEVLLNFTATTGYWAELVFLAGGVETCCDEVIVYDGLNGTGNIIYGALTGGGLSDYSTVPPVVSSTGTLSLVINADGSNTCSSVGYTPFDVVVNCVVPPTCLVPSALTVDEITEEKIRVSWAAGGSETEWNVVWGPTGFTPGDGNQLGSVDVTTLSYIIDGLTENTAYDVYVKATCDPDDQSLWSAPLTARTYCLSLSLFPWTEDFENPGLPACWEVIDANNDLYKWGIFAGYGVGGSNAAGLYTDYHAGDNDDYLVLPRFKLTGNQRLKFSVRARSADEPNDYRVVLSTTGRNAADFTDELLPLTVVSHTTHEEIDWIDLSAYAGDVFIAVHVPSGGLDGYYIYVDDFVLDHFPCPPVSALATTDVTYNSATLEWVADGNLFDIEMVKAGETPTGIATYTGVTKPFTVADLEHSTAYEFYIRQDCAPNRSDWTGPLVVTTLDDPCAGVTAPAGNALQEVLYGSSLADLVVAGDNLRWYTDDELRHEVDANTVFDAVGSFTRYVTQTVGSCASDVLAITVTVAKAPLIITAKSGQNKVYGDIDPEFTYIVSGYQDSDDNSILSGILSRIAGEDVGTYVIERGDLSAGDNYDIDFIPADFEITEATLTVIADDNQSKVYGEADPVLTYTVSGFQSSDDETVLTGSLNRATGEDVGTYQIEQGDLSAGGNYEIDFTAADFAITQATLTVVADDNQSKVYGEADPVLTYTISGFQGSDDETVLTGSLNKAVGEDVGSYAIDQGDLSAGANYNIDFTGSDFAITQQTITGITLDDATFTYDGTAKSLAIAGTLPAGTSVTYTGNDQTDAGIYAVTVAIDGGNNYEDLTLTAELTIDKATINGITFEDGSFVYDGMTHSLEISGTLPAGTSVSYTNNDQTDAGIYTVTAVIDGRNNYEDLTLTAELIIGKAQITGITLGDAVFIYDGTAKSLAIAGTLPAGASMGYTGNDQTDAGNYTVTAVIDGGTNYEDLTLTAELIIGKAQITGITFADATFTYDDTEKSLAIAGTLPAGSSVSYTGNDQTDAGIYTVTAAIDGGTNYEDLTLDATLTIEKAVIQGITFADDSFVYDGTAKSLAIAGTLPDGASVSYVNNDQTEAGTYTVTAEIDGENNYESLTLTATLTIEKASITGITLNDATFIYDGTSKSLMIAGTLPTGTSVTYTNNDQTDAGEYRVEAEIDGGINFESLRLSALLTIDKASLSDITFEDARFVYDGTAKSLAIAGTLPDGASVSYANNEQTEAGVYNVTASIDGGTNYEGLTLMAALRIEKAASILRFADITPVGRDAGTVRLDVQSNSPMPIHLYSDNELVAVVTGNLEVEVRGVGMTQIRAEQAGDANHHAADAVVRELRVVPDEGAKLPVRVHPALSPNGDGVNDFLRVEGIEEYPDNVLRLFNSNGQIFYEGRGYNNGSVRFEGATAGGQLAEGTYYYVLELRVDGKYVYDKGFFVIRY